ncbi:MAG TPA: protein kinase, partial [Gemmatimonadales bacterium]|nr:protein kinase [Gemmatimonadales bacterium]
TAQLQHPHILPLFDSGQADGFLFYVMPFIDGETLRAKLDRETQLGIDEAVKITVAVADALDYAHRHGVIHRDIKPENILLHDGRPMVADFGIALALSAAAGGRMTETGMSLGTPHYMSPEQATADKEITGRSDIYSLGSVLYEMLAGEPPHIGHSAQQIIMKIIAEEVQPVTKHRKAVPPNVAAAVAHALEKLPADRFATAREFAEALSDRGFSTVATGVAAARPSTRRSAPLYAALLIIAALAAWGWLRPAPLRPVNRYSMGFLPDQGFREGVAGINLAISPDGRRIVYAGPGETDGQLWLRDRDRLDAVPIPGTAGATNPFFSPDGKSIAFASGAASALTVVPVAGGPPITLDAGGVGSAGGGAWGPDGWIYFDTPQGTARIRANGGTKELLIGYDSTAHEIGFAWTEALPNGKGLVFRARRNLDVNDFDIDAFDLRTHTRHFLTKGLMARYVAPGYLVVLRADGAVLAAPFDQDKLALTGPTVPLFSGVMVKPLGSADLAISRAGTLVYAPGTGVSPSGYSEVISMDRAGRVSPFTPALTYNPSTNHAISLSPDGRRLAFDVQGNESPDLWVKQLPNGALSRLTFDSSGAERPTWSADGRYVYYISATRGNASVWRRRADGSAPPEFVWADPKGSILAVSFSHDGQWLVYRLSVGRTGYATNRDIYAVHLGHDSVATALLTSPSFEDAPALSPDGRWMAYTSNESGRDEIYVRPFPNVGQGRWQISTNGGVAARWSHSGRELFFQDPAGDILSVASSPGPTFTPSDPHQVVANTTGANVSLVVPYYDVTPDDQSFLMVRRAGGTQDSGGGQMVVVDNWTTELLAKMKGH